jgi:uncharacterized glyoxalase superfamily protein PhnB
VGFRDAFPIFHTAEWGERMAAVHDPDGNVISLGQKLG